MLCPYCKDDSGHLLCTQTLLPAPQRLDRVLVRTGQWECDCCGFTKPIYAKQPVNTDPNEIFKSISCFCCGDTGAIHHQFVKASIMPDYLSIDPPVPCRRCNAGLKVQGWDIATKADCEQIHRAQLSKVKFSPAQEDVSTLIRSAIKSI